MLRLSAPGRELLERTPSLDVHVGGAESNVAAALARLGTPSAWVSVLPDNPLGHRVERAVAGAGVDTSSVRFVEVGRVGLYFVEFGSQPRSTTVWYDRAASAFAEAATFEPAQLDGARYAVISGITPALSPRAREANLAFAAEARARDAAVVLDVNYRSRLWEPEPALTGIEPLVREARIVVCSARDAATVFGIEGTDADVVTRLAADWAPSAEVVCLTCSDRGVVAFLNGEVISRPAVPAAPADRFGAGDAFVAGLLDALLCGRDAGDAIAFGCGLAALKATVPGDMCPFTRADVASIVAGEVLRR
jgi:2-dehydro-3-deoxygluconokinase